MSYFRKPTLYKNKIVFVSEDDLWTVNLDGGIATRLTNTAGSIFTPYFSPDGTKIAFSSSDEGIFDAYVMDLESGEIKRLTYHPAGAMVVGWHPTENKILFRSAKEACHPREEDLFAISPNGGAIECFHWGEMTLVAFDSDGETVALQRGYADPATWKRYHGGRTGQIWIGNRRTNEFKLLTPEQTPQVAPFFWNHRIYFVSDVDGIGNIYSYTLDGKDIQQHTYQKEFYVRWPQHFENIVVYQCGGDLWKLDLSTNISSKIDIKLQTCNALLRNHKISPASYLNNYELSPKQDKIMITARGSIAVTPLWQGAVSYLGEITGVRHKLASWCSDNTHVIAVNDASENEKVVLYDINKPREYKICNVTEKNGYHQLIQPAPVGKWVAIVVNSELYVYNWETDTSIFITSANHRYFADVSWSSDGAWLAYAKFDSDVDYSSIYLYSMEAETSTRLTFNDTYDYSPCFDPKGRYLYFLSNRTFNPYGDRLQNEYIFPAMSKPYLFVLQADQYSPFSALGSLASDNDDEKEQEDNKKDSEENKEEDNKESKKEEEHTLDEWGAVVSKEKDATAEEKEKKFTFEEKVEKIHIDLDGLSSRIVPIPCNESRYYKLSACDDKILMLEHPVTGECNESSIWEEEKDSLNLISYDLKEKKDTTLFQGIKNYSHELTHKKMIVESEKKLRICKAGEKPSKDAPKTPGKESGIFDWDRLQIMVNPKAEWQQMYNEAWRWQRDFYWSQAMNGCDWEAMRIKYMPLLQRVTTKSELVDVLWELQGELGTSHAYVVPAMEKTHPSYRVGTLGVDFDIDENLKRYRIARIYYGDRSQDKKMSPLAQPGVNAHIGDYLLRINDYEVTTEQQPYQYLLNMAGHDVSITFSTDGTEEKAYNVVVQPLSSELPIRYQQWVKDNRDFVSKCTGNKVGYIHVPDMGVEGLIEFHRSYLWQFNKPGLIIDLRHNGGGHVSSVLLEKLQRQLLGYCTPRYGARETYPYHTTNGVFVALCDENTGSDGDIFCQAFRDLHLGTLIGKRTWGGVIGIQADKRLVDNSILTQPEYAFHFTSHSEVENHGVVPDIVVDLDPKSIHDGCDPQLNKAIDVIMKKLSKEK